jgi:hypothetical protein
MRLILTLLLALTSPLAMAQAKKSGGGGGWDFEGLTQNPNTTHMLIIREAIKKNSKLEFSQGEEKAICKVDALTTSIAQTLASKPDLALVKELQEELVQELADHQLKCLQKALDRISRSTSEIQLQFSKP